MSCEVISGRDARRVTKGLRSEKVWSRCHSYNKDPRFNLTFEGIAGAKKRWRRKKCSGSLVL